MATPAPPPEPGPRPTSPSRPEGLVRNERQLAGIDTEVLLSWQLDLAERSLRHVLYAHRDHARLLICRARQELAVPTETSRQALGDLIRTTENDAPVRAAKSAKGAVLIACGGVAWGRDKSFSLRTMAVLVSHLAASAWDPDARALERIWQARAMMKVLGHEWSSQRDRAAPQRFRSVAMLCHEGLGVLASIDLAVSPLPTAWPDPAP